MSEPDPARPGTGSAAPFVFASRRDTLIAREPLRMLSCPSSVDLGRCARTFFSSVGRDAHQGGALLVGALPFSHDAPVHLFHPRRVERWPVDRSWLNAIADGEAPVSKEGPAPDDWRVRAEPSRREYADRVVDVLARIRDADGERLRKVVLGRRLLLEGNRPVDLRLIAERLSSDPASTTYVVPLPPGPDGSPRTLAGASPELLIAKSGTAIRSGPMAGSTPRRIDRTADRAAADALQRNDKDLREHAMVVESVLDRLAPFCRSLRGSEAPFVTGTATMWHLTSSVEGELRDPDIPSIELAAILHPTPAVCGMPCEAARSAIAELEPFDRGYFGGAVGWCDASGDGEWLVTIRCGEICGNQVTLYAGAGIVAGSDPESEADETSGKLATFLRALGVDEDGRPRRATSE